MRSFRSDQDNESNTLLGVIAQEAIVGIMSFDPASRMCIDINRVAQETLDIGFGENFEGLILKLDELFPGEGRGRARAFSEEMFKTEGLFQNVLMRKPKGLAIVVNVAVKHVTFEGGVRRVLLMFQDVVNEKKMQRELELKSEEIRNAYTQVLEQNRQLIALDSAKDRFIALTTHELRTPLSAIVATTEVLQLKLYESDQQHDQFIATLYEQSRHLMELVNDILDFAKIRAGKMDLYVERADVVSIVAKIVTGFEQMAAQNQVVIEIERPAAGIEVYADVLRLKEIVSNVVNNAIKFNRPGGRVRVGFHHLENEKLARIAVEDTGIGIPAARLEHVFNEFETIGHVSRHQKGTGLGMPISKRLAEVMGGALSLTSVEGQGSTFFIDLPLEKVLAPEHYRSRADTWGGDQAA